MGLVSVSAVIATVLVAAAPPVSAETTATVKGKVVTIHVSVDVYGGEGQTGPNGERLDEYWKQVLKDTWGTAFDHLPYKNCVKFELDVDIKLRKRTADNREGRHRLHVTASRTPGDWENVGWGGAPETSRDSATGDGSRSFENDRFGTLPVNAPPAVIAHEFGHLMGLGDDRENGHAKNGRDGTLMVGGVPGVDPTRPLRIDQNLIDRIAGQIKKALEDKGKSLPECETWKGTGKGTVQSSGCAPVSQSVRLTLAIVEHGKVNGTGTTTAGAYTCDNGASIPVMSNTYTFTGTKTDDAFDLTSSDGVSVHLPIRGDQARGAQDTGAGTITITLRCTTCDDDRVA